MRIVKTNSLIHLSDLMRIRESYSMTAKEHSVVSERYQMELSELENRVFVVGFDKDESPAAYVQLILKNADNDPELANGHDTAHVHDLRVRSDLQGQGFGRRIMSYLEDEARLRGFKILTLGVDNWNTRAVGFYEKQGFTKFKESPGRTEEEVCFLMKKLLV